MREIKFRGKRPDEDRWRYGDLDTTGTGVIRIRNRDDCVRVLEETVGQYTGLKDKNGIEIYEGDIDKYGFIVTYVDSSDTGNSGMFIGFYTQRDNFESWLELSVGDEIEIIGNIHE